MSKEVSGDHVLLAILPVEDALALGLFTEHVGADQLCAGVEGLLDKAA